jgi:hypothetical protein
MGRGRKPIHQTDEDRERAIKESKMKYYKKNKADILKKNKDRYHKNKVVDDMVDDVTFEAFDDDTSGDYEGIIT